MEKPTKRKAFNFLRSYFDVINELQNDTDKLEFVMAVINKQFLDEDPKELNFVVNLCYQSQKHAVESSVKGWKRVSNTDLIGNPTTNPTTIPMTNPTTNPQEVEEKVKVEEKEKVQNVKEKLSKKDVDKFLLWFNNTKLKYKNSVGKFKILNATDINNLLLLKKLNYTAEDFDIAFKEMCNSAWVNENNMCTPAHFLRNDNFTRYLNASETESEVKFKAAWQ
jgi:hypothetical protein